MTPEEIVSCIDLTSLNSADTDSSIRSLCEKSKNALGHVAAVCCYPQFLKVARASLPEEVLLATVINFPRGDVPFLDVIAEAKSAIAEGADELDLVVPYRSILLGDLSTSIETTEAVKACCADKTLKVIIETGELKDTGLIFRLSLELLAHGADFIKTSTGKTQVGATEEAVNAILRALQQYHLKTDDLKGLKVSGGIKTLQAAKLYMNLAEEYFGETYLKPATFRIGASSLLDEVLRLQIP